MGEVDENSFWGGFVTGVMLMIMVSVLLWSIDKACYQADAIKAGAAQYNATTGRFEWKKPE